jgi:DNA repair protein RadC
MNYDIKSNIKSWAEEDRPREKLLLKGKGQLTDAEHLAILIGSGTKELSAVDLSKLILSHAGNNLNNLAKLSLKDLMKFKGIGEAKAITIVSALELGRRRKESEEEKRTKITSSYVAYQYFSKYLLDLDHEEFWILLLNRNLEIIKPIQISTGGVSGTVADPKIIFKNAIEHLASAVILTHNHPSGNLNPSNADIQLTKRIVELGIMLEITISDHIIFTNNGFYSFADDNKL